MISVVCVKCGSKYAPDYVNRLLRMVSRRLSLPFSFVCLTDDAGGLDSTIACQGLPYPALDGWWNKLSLFKPGELSGVCLYFDLDVVIHSNIDRLATYGEDDTFAIPRDFYGPDQWFNSSVMKFNAERHATIWEEWASKRTLFSGLAGDQEVITCIMRQDVTTRCFPDEWIWSYKWGAARGKHVKLDFPPVQAMVSVFHGRPKPHEVHDPWVREHWR